VRTKTKKIKGVGKALVSLFGFFSFLFSLFIVSAITFGMIGGIFMSPKPLFQFKRVKGPGAITSPNRKHTEWGESLI
jgi:hypothetical protein